MKNRLLKITVTGSDGLVGNSIQRISQDINQVIELLDEDTKKIIKKENPIFKFIFLNRKTMDLSNKEMVYSLMKTHKPDIVIHLAAKVGGLFANQKDNQTFYFENLHMSENLLGACYAAGVSHTFSFLSTCIYPSNEKILPYKEEQLHFGEPHNSNYGYAFAKRQHEVMARLYNEKGMHNVCLIPNNLYGPNDQFGKETSHVIPGIISKAFDSLWHNKIYDPSLLRLPGSGLAIRQFTYVDDVAKQTLAYMLYYFYSKNEYKPNLLNIGNKNEYVIRDIIRYVDYAFKERNLILNPQPITLCFKNSDFNEKEDGIFRKPSSLNLLHSILPKTKETIDLKDGIAKTVDWFLTKELV